MICENFPGTGGWKTFRDVLMDMCDDAVLRNGDGQIAALQMLKQKESGSCTVYGSPELREDQKALFTDVTFENYKAGKKAYEKVYELPWEVETFEEILEKEVYPLIKNGDSIRIEGAVSEDQTVRSRMRTRMEEKAKSLGAAEVRTELICAYKQGFSWID